MKYESIELPENAPERGFYYHYKHDPAGPVNNYAYEFLAIGHHTEDDCRPEDALLANYRPLYETALVYQMGKLNDNRPLGMFMETVEVKGKMVPRFTRITDPETIRQLKEIRNEMYPKGEYD